MYRWFLLEYTDDNKFVENPDRAAAGYIPAHEMVHYYDGFRGADIWAKTIEEAIDRAESLCVEMFRPKPAGSWS